MQLIKMKMGDSPILVEADGQIEEQSTYRYGKKEIIEKIDKSLDEMIQQGVVAYCKTLTGVFGQLKKQSIPPKKINSEFGFQINAEGNLYITKVSSQSSFKISIEWE